MNLSGSRIAPLVISRGRLSSDSFSSEPRTWHDSGVSEPTVLWRYFLAFELWHCVVRQACLMLSSLKKGSGEDGLFESGPASVAHAPIALSETLPGGAVP